MSENFDDEIFAGKTFSDLLKEIHKKSNTKAKQINQLVRELQPLVKSIGDATVIVPLIKDYLDVGVKNDELLVKIAVIVQRHVQKANDGNGESWDIPQQEIDDLVEAYQNNSADIKDIKIDVEEKSSEMTTKDKFTLPDLDEKTEESNG